MFALLNIRVLTGRVILTRPRRVVAIAALASCASISALAASPAPAESARPAADPAALAAELNTELHFVYRDNVPEYTRRSEQVRRALDAWNASSKSAAERDQIIAWLRESIRLSMPGSAKPLPPLPEPVHEPVAPAKVTAPAEPTSKSVLTAKPVVVEPRPAAEARAVSESKSTPVPKSVSGPPAAATATPNDTLEDNPFRDDPALPR
jgi:hypothetical protein